MDTQMPTGTLPNDPSATPSTSSDPDVRLDLRFSDERPNIIAEGFDLGGRCRVEAVVLSPAKQHLAVRAEARSFLGVRVRQVGAVYAVGEKSVAGRIAPGKREGADDQR
jgi:hypothetical protein